MIQRIVRFFHEDHAQDLVEYSLLIAFVAMAAAGVLSQVGVGVQGPWSSAKTTLAAANGTPSAITSPPAGGGGDSGGRKDGRDGR
jgi:Flp pilus assembly pilin Flp